MRYDLSDPYGRARFEARARAMIQKQCPDAELIDRSRRSLAQNAYLHVLLGIVAMETGETVEYVKRVYFKAHCNPGTFLVRHYDRHIGHEAYRLRSTSELTAEETSAAITRFRDWAATEGIYLPTPEEGTALRRAEQAMTQNMHI